LDVFSFVFAFKFGLFWYLMSAIISTLSCSKKITRIILLLLLYSFIICFNIHGNYSMYL
jgi:hypothetical protein